MLQRPTREEGLGCLFGIVGGLVGFLDGARSFAAQAEAMRAADPEGTVCGVPALGGMIGGMFLGGLGGMLVGMVLSRLLPSSRPEG